MTRLRSITTLICFASCTGIFAQSLEGQLGAPIKGQPGTVKGGSYAIMGITGTDVGTLSVFSHGFPARALEDNDVVQRGPSSKIYEVVAPAVVLVVVRTGNDQYATGSGSVIHRDGYIITSAHVVGRERQVVVIFKPVLEGAKPSEADTRTAEVVRLNEVTDLALLKVKSLPARIKPVPLGTLASVKVGADVHAIGHPQGESWTYTKGVVSQLRRDYEAHFGDRTIRATVIQTQTPINPGNSGGPLLDDNGNLIGVNAFVNREAQGLNYELASRRSCSSFGPMHLSS